MVPHEIDLFLELRVLILHLARVVEARGEQDLFLQRSLIQHLYRALTVRVALYTVVHGPEGATPYRVSQDIVVKGVLFGRFGVNV